TIEFAPPHEPNEKLFRMVRACLEALEQSPDQLAALVRYFEVWMLKLSGFLPDLRRCAECNITLIEQERTFLNAELKPRCLACSKGLGSLLLKETQTQFQSIQRLSPKEFALSIKDDRKKVWDEMGQITQKLIGRALEREPRGRMAFS
ncbi:MAG: DNA repair protein RecO C-terminal domain-containing protein, partial [Pyrinomonadaceae bacterium]